jgi:DNA-binding CsgD family transcriptional regulator
MARNTYNSDEFDFITDKQAAVLNLLANHRTSKEIAHTLRLSETAVNRRIEVVRQRLGGISRPELARRYSDWAAAQDRKSPPKSLKNKDSSCVENGSKILPLAANAETEAEAARDDKAGSKAFEDPVAMAVEPPWKDWKEPRIVPRVLDGENATLARGATIAILLVAIIASLVLALAAAKALADAVN